jgi:hypothetical protein
MGEGVSLKEYRAAKTAAGLCHQCSAPLDSKSRLCQRCRHLAADHALARRKERQEARLCGQCGEIVDSGTVCGECQKKARDYQNNRYSKGLCAACNNPRSPSLTTCERCRVATNVRTEKRRGLKVSRWKKRGRRIYVEGGKQISHEEAVRSAVRAAAQQIATGIVCACGYPIEKPKNGAAPKRCDMCQYDFEREQKRAKWTKNGNARGARPADDAEKVAANKARKQRAAKAMRERRAALKASGKCIGCGKLAREGLSTCKECSKKNAALHSARRAKNSSMVRA